MRPQNVCFPNVDDFILVINFRNSKETFDIWFAPNLSIKAWTR